MLLPTAMVSMSEISLIISKRIVAHLIRCDSEFQIDNSLLDDLSVTAIALLQTKTKRAILPREWLVGSG